MKTTPILYILFCFIALPFIAHAQNDTTYLNNYFRKTNYHFGTYYRVVYPRIRGPYKVKIFSTLDNSIQEQGTYSYYNKYQNDSTIKDGDWLSYQNNVILSSQHYVHDTLDGEEKRYYTDSLSHGLHMISYWHHGHRDSLLSYYPDCKLKRIEIYNLHATSEKHKYLVKKCYDEAGNEIPFTPYYVMPKCPYAIYKFIGRHIHYPNTARMDNIEGQVVIRFTIDTDGSIIDISVIKSVRKDIDQEAVNVVKQMPRWTPGMEDGKLTKVFFTLPITFQLQ